MFASARNAAYWAIDSPVGFSAASHRRRALAGPA